MLKDSRAAFPNGIRAIVVDSDARFLRSASLMLSLLNFLVATCETPASAVKLLSGRLKDADVVFIDALRATTCGFDFRGIVESHLLTPVVYFFSFDYKVAGELAEALRRTVWAATYVIKKPLDADDLCRLWMVIGWSKILLQSGKKTLPWLDWPRGSRELPDAVQALLASSSTSEDQGEEDDDDDNGGEHFKAVTAGGRGRRRKLGDSHDGGSSSGRGRGRGRGRRGGIAVGGQPTRSLAEQMNVAEGPEQSDDDDVVLIPQQPAQQNRQGVQAMGVQNQQPQGRSLFMPQPVTQMLNMPRNNPMIWADAAGPSSSNAATAFAGAGNISAPALLPAYQQAPAQARATSPAAQAPAPELPPPVHQQQQQPVSLYNLGKMVAPPAPVLTTMAATSGKQPQFALNEHRLHQQDMFVPRRQGSWMRRRRETGPIMLSFQKPHQAVDLFTQMAQMAGGDTTFGASSSAAGATDAGLLSPNIGAQPTDSFDDVLRAMMEMNETFKRSCNANCSAEALMSPATDELAAMKAALGSGSGSGGNYNAGSSFMVKDVNGGNSSVSFMAPQDLTVPTGKQVEVELGAPDIYGSLVGPSEGPSTMFNWNGDMAADIYGSLLVQSPAMFNGNGDMAAMFPASDQYDENAMFPMDALWDFQDGIPVHPEGQQVAAVDSTAAANANANATGIMSNGGESGALGPNWNMGAADNGRDMLEEYLMDNNAPDFQLPQDRNNGHQ